jgi:hypothetical protein
MEFIDPQKANTKESAARMFGSTVMRLLVYVHDVCLHTPINHNAAHNDAPEITDYIGDLRKKYRTVYDGIMSPEQVIEKIGPILFNWRGYITTYDVSFFITTDLINLFSVAGAKQNPKLVDNDLRDQLARVLTDESRVIVFDALNLLLILYSRYTTFTH